MTSGVRAAASSLGLEVHVLHAGSERDLDAAFATLGKLRPVALMIAPGFKRVAVLRDAALALGMGQLGALQSVAPSFGVELRPVGVADANEIERGITAFTRDPNGALIVTVSPGAIRYRELIIGLAARHKLPAVFPYRFFATDGGLITYGPDTIEPYRRAAGYVDRILKGEKPADLPVPAPTRFELAINLKTAKALGLTVPPTLLARADEVIE
jgi:putative ABC transport system substrate-binding protein